MTDQSLQYSIIKKSEHFWKGLSNPKSQISAIPPEPYGERFIRFITGTTKTQEEAERERLSGDPGLSLETQRLSGHLSRSSTDRVMEKAEKQARKSEKDGAGESERPDRTLSAVRSPSADRSNGVTGATLPVVEEAGEAGSTSGRSREESVAAGEERVRDRDSHNRSADSATGSNTATSTMTGPTTIVAEPSEFGAEPATEKSGTPTSIKASHPSLHKVKKGREHGEEGGKEKGQTGTASTAPPEDLAVRLRESFYMTGPAL